MRLFILITITVFLGIGTTTNAQPTVFNKVYDAYNSIDGGNALTQLSDSNYLIVGGYTNVGINGAWILKLNNLGNILWTKEYDLTIGGDNAYGIQELSNGNLLIAGTLHDTATVTAKPYLMLLNSLGDSIWMKQYNGSLNIGNSDWATSLVLTPDGGFVVSGFTFMGPSFASLDAWGFKTDSLGNLLWQKQFDGHGLDDFFEKVIITPDSNIVCAGYTVLNMDTAFDFVVKLNQQGDTLWTKQIGGLGGTFDINSTQDGGFIGCGYIYINNTQRAKVYRLDNFGNLIWAKDFARGNGLSEYYSFSAIHELPNGNFMAAGVDFDYSQPVPGGSPRIRMMEFNALGDSIWSKQYPHSTGTDDDYLFDMKLTSDGGFIMCGYVIHNSPTKNDVLVIKVDSNRCADTTCQLAVGVEETLNLQPPTLNFLIYPNPSQGSFTIAFNHTSSINEEYYVEVYNMLGAKIITQVLVNQSINLSAFNNGIYLIRITNSKGNILFTNRLILQKG